VHTHVDFFCKVPGLFLFLYDIRDRGKGMIIDVQCHAGYRGNERPTRLRFGDTVIEVTRVLDRWYEPEYSYFKVLGSDASIYILKYSEPHDEWKIVFFSKAGG
jgi:hypothetical protein